MKTSHWDRQLDLAIDEITRAWWKVVLSGVITSLALIFGGGAVLWSTILLLAVAGKVAVHAGRGAAGMLWLAVLALVAVVAGLWLAWQMVRYVVAVLPLVRSHAGLEGVSRRVARRLAQDPKVRDEVLLRQFQITADELRRVRCVMKAGGFDI